MREETYLRKPLRIGVIIFALLLSSFGLKAQQDPLYSQYTFNSLAFNPAYAGSEDHLAAMVLSRHQWLGFEGAPSTQTLVGHAPIKDNLGLGLTLLNDRLGPVKQTGFYVDFAYKVKLTQTAKLSFGLKGGGNLMQANLSELDLYEDSDEAFLLGNESTFLPNFGFGLLFQEEKFFVSLSLPRMIRNDLGTSAIEPTVNAGELRHFFLMGGYKYAINETLRLEPTLMFRQVKNAPLAIDVVANLVMKDKFHVGLMYRLGNALGAQLQYTISDKLRIGYAYDLSTTGLGQYNSGTHEIMLRFDMVKKPVDTPQEPEAE